MSYVDTEQDELLEKLKTLEDKTHTPKHCDPGVIQLVVRGQSISLCEERIYLSWGKCCFPLLPRGAKQIRDYRAKKDTKNLFFGRKINLISNQTIFDIYLFLVSLVDQTMVCALQQKAVKNKCISQGQNLINKMHSILSHTLVIN